MNPVANDILKHYGVPRRSGRYPWGSGKDPFQRSGDFLARVDELKKTGMSQTEIASTLGLNTSQLRTQIGLAKDERRALEVETAKGLRAKGVSLQEIAKQMGYANDSSVRSLLDENSEARMNQAKNAADFLRKQVDEKGMIDVGIGVERELGISKEKLNQALYILELEGYNTFGGGVPQPTNKGQQTNIKVLTPPDTPYKTKMINGKEVKVTSAIYDFENINSVRNYISHDGGDTFDPKWVYPKSMDSSRIYIRYDEDGGSERDGLVEIRRGVDDISLGGSRYSQVRILVDDDKYIKGMAAYSDNIPDGYDIVFNSNKKQGTPLNKVLKPIDSDPDNPFGSLIKEGIVDPTNPTGDKKGGQSYYIDDKGEKQLSLINKRADEGDWHDWKDGLPSQFLSKQSNTLIKKQLNLAADERQREFDDISSLNNPTLKKVLLRSFADDCDAAAIHLQAASLPRQKYQVILPVPEMKDTEIYAPNFNNGEKVALIRYPHGGTFEIPVLTVNNRQKNAKKLLGTDPSDAVGINSKVAEILSGADFDGDTVMIIPTNDKTKISAKPPLKDLEGFDPKLEYGGKKEGSYKVMKNTQTEMGKISNLITDMTLKGATSKELAKAVKHSMVVIDAEKHKLDYKQSELDNDISALKKKYQGSIGADGRYREGASTLISRAKSETSVLKRQGSPIIDPETGKQSYKEVREEYKVYKTVKDPITGNDIRIDTGKTKVRTQRSTKMGETDDAFTLVSEADTPQERAYAEYANKMKALGNRARKEMISTGKIAYSASAKEAYREEVDSLTAALNVALKNAPRERQALVIANAEVKAKRQANPDMTQGEIKKANHRALTSARAKVGAERKLIEITDKKWEAIQAGAISENKLYQILNNVDVDELRKRATPRANKTISGAKLTRMKSMNAAGYTNAEIAKALGVSPSTVLNYLK